MHDPHDSRSNADENEQEAQIDLSDPAIQEFKAAFETQYLKYSEALFQEYLKVKKSYTDVMEAKFDELHKEHKGQYEVRNQKIVNLTDQLNSDQRRMDHLLDAIQNFILLKQKRVKLRKALDQWKSSHRAEKEAKARKIYFSNYEKRRLMKRSFLGWRKEAHLSRKREIEQEFVFKTEQLKNQKLGAYDRRVKEMLAKIEAARRILAEEIAVKERLTLQYEQALGRGVNVLSKETQIISNNPLVTGNSSPHPRAQLHPRQNHPRRLPVIVADAFESGVQESLTSIWFISL